MSDNVRKVCAHPRRQWAKCECPWHFAFKWKETHHRFSLDKHLGRHIDSKSEAVEEAATIRKAIKAGTFGQVTPVATMTLRQLADIYIERFVDVQRKDTRADYVAALSLICRTSIPRAASTQAAPLGGWRLTDIVTDTIERFREVRRAQGTVATNRNLQTLRALFNWGIRTGYVTTTPFKLNSEPVIKLERELKRDRRLQADEESKLLAAAGPHLCAILEAAVENGMRRGAILSMHVSQIEGVTFEEKVVRWASRAEVVLPPSKTKTRTGRRIPISTRLRAVLELRLIDPAGQPLPADGYVFGTEVGTRVLDVKRAWATAVLKAHGHEPSYTKTANLSPESQAALAAIDLHFHDLRREAGSRWIEGGVPIHTVRDWLGHANVSQTSTYLAGVTQSAHDAMRRFEERQGALQQIATEVGTGGQTGARSAEAGVEKAQETAINHHQEVM